MASDAAGGTDTLLRADLATDAVLLRVEWGLATGAAAAGVDTFASVFAGAGLLATLLRADFALAGTAGLAVVATNVPTSIDSSAAGAGAALFSPRRCFLLALGALSFTGSATGAAATTKRNKKETRVHRA